MTATSDELPVSSPALRDAFLGIYDPPALSLRLRKVVCNDTHHDRGAL